ncbi:uncharacterized protein Tco025E_02474 [Trypanosoma conorhini]|uniref:Uncharacterized protein n=1 Tax=Trypanosoma conorhini TaxID=83891 RepID=A0A3R7PFS4_9TRYP|nr:uncharacterized protein Tco025E_02474 [Trypanosoma conorhini]RNF24647.1 hypothetical protein Tco025E_02474 [Trypanosoma conorhini]
MEAPAPSPPKAGESHVPRTQERRELTLLGLLAEKAQLSNGQLSPVLRNGAAHPPRTSPVIASGAHDFWRLRYNHASPAHPGEGEERATAPSPPHPPATAPQDPATSSPVPRGAVGGRRTFKRHGLQCLGARYTDNARFAEETGGISGEANNVSTLDIKVGGQGLPCERQLVRLQNVASSLGSSARGLGGRAATNSASMSPGVGPQEASCGKIRNPNFTGTHRLRRNCPRHGVVSAGDAHVAELPRTDSSHYIRPYALTSTTTPVSASEAQGDKQSRPERRRATLGIATEALATAPEQKSSAMLARTLSDLRSKSRRSCLESSPLGTHKSVLNSTKGGKGLGVFLQQSSSSLCDTRIICEQWDEAGSSSNSTNKNNANNAGVCETRSTDSDEDSCCSSCSCFLDNDRRVGGDGVVNGAVIEQHASVYSGVGATYCVTYDNFFDESDIPMLSMNRFRRSSSPSGNRILTSEAQPDPQL